MVATGIGRADLVITIVGAHLAKALVVSAIAGAMTEIMITVDPLTGVAVTGSSLF